MFVENTYIYVVKIVLKSTLGTIRPFLSMYYWLTLHRVLTFKLNCKLLTSQWYNCLIVSSFCILVELSVFFVNRHRSMFKSGLIFICI